jgi:hypothetical protein
MAHIADMEGLQAQMEDLWDQLGALRIGETSRGQSKDVSLVARIKEWTGESKGKSVYEFLAQVETLAKVSGWTSQDKALITKAKLQGLALQYLNGREELVHDRCTYETLKQALVERFSDKLPNQYYYTRLQDAVQGRDESAEEFSDRCRKMCQRTARKVHDEETQKIINEEAEHRLLTAYIHGLKGIVGQQVQFQMPGIMEQAVRLAITVENAEKHKQLTGGAKKVFANKREIECFKCTKRGHFAKDCWQGPHHSGQYMGHDQTFRQRDFPSRDPRSPQGGRGWGRPGFQNFRKPTRQWATAEGARPLGIQCFYCREYGHRYRDCPKLSRAAQHPNGQGSTPRSPVSNQPQTARK